MDGLRKSDRHFQHFDVTVERIFSWWNTAWLGDTGAVVLGIVSGRELIAQRSNTGMTFFSVSAVVCCDLVMTSPLKHVVLWQQCKKLEQKACTLGTNHKWVLSNSGCKWCYFKNDRSWGARNLVCLYSFWGNPLDVCILLWIFKRSCHRVCHFSKGL